MDTLTNLQKKILKILNNLQDIEALYLTGGTALSLYLKHRKSFDIDLFTASEELILPFSNNLEKVLKENGLDTKRTKTFHTFTEFVVTEEDTITVIQIALDSPYKLSKPVIFEDFPNLKISSFIDISANKLLALLGRSDPRDFIDVYFIIKSGKLSREQLIESAKKKDTGFDLYWLAIAFKNAELLTQEILETYMVDKISLKELKQFFKNWQEEIVKEIL